jgi:hypothetical protein
MYIENHDRSRPSASAFKSRRSPSTKNEMLSRRFPLDVVSAILPHLHSVTRKCRSSATNHSVYYDLALYNFNGAQALIRKVKFNETFVVYNCSVRRVLGDCAFVGAKSNCNAAASDSCSFEVGG